MTEVGPLVAFITAYPEVVVFVAIAAGHWLGGLRIGAFSIGPVAGALVAGLLIGQIATVPVAGMAKSYLFLLFLFGVGYSAGPQFLQAMRRDGLKPLLMTVVCNVAGLLAALAAAKLLKLDAGLAAGLMAGGLTQSPAIGSASEAIRHLPLAEAERAAMTARVAVGYAVCYVFGSVGAIWFCSHVGPWLLRIDLRREAAALEQSLGMKAQTPGVESGYRPFQLRAYRLPAGAAIVGLSVREAEHRVADQRLAVLRVRRGEAILDAAPELKLAAGDVLAIGGRRAAVIEVLGGRADEAEDFELLDMPIQVSDVFVTAAETAGQTLAQIAAADWARGVFLQSLERAGLALPIAPGIVVERGDVLRLIGPAALLARAQPKFGRVIDPKPATDLVTLGLMILVGAIVGVAVRFTVMGVEVSLGTSVGVLLAGIATGWLRTRRPLFGRIPDSALGLMTSLGLSSFIAMVGLQSAPDFGPALLQVGWVFPLAGLATAVFAMTVGLLFGRHMLRMNPILLLGSLAGAMTATAAMAAVQTRAATPLPVLGYAPAYPVAQVLLTMWGSLIVFLVA